MRTYYKLFKQPSLYQSGFVFVEFISLNEKHFIGEWLTETQFNDLKLRENIKKSEIKLKL